MAKPLLTDELWAHIAPLLPPLPPQPKGGRPPVPHRAALTGILFVLKTGLPWENLRAEGVRVGHDRWRRLHAWKQADVWPPHRVLQERLEAAGQLDWSRASLDSTSVPAKKGGLRRGRTRPIGASRARSATLSPTRAARRSASC